MTMQQEIIVQKYGGSSVASPEKLKAVALLIKNCLHEANRICVVVSAMGNTTNELITLAHKVSENPVKRELDMLISCGERSSMALLAMALHDIGVKAVSLTGSQSGIITDDQHHGAEIIAIKPNRVLEAFLTYQVVIIAGFQGVSERKEITTLRRGGSDTTAVAMAAAVNASRCEIYTDVRGVMDMDPRIVPHAQILPTILCETMESMALYGARVLAHDAIRLARQFGVNVRVAQTGDLKGGTNIRTIDFVIENQKAVVALTHLRAIVRFSVSEKSSWFKNLAGYFLCGAQRGEEFVGYISNDISQEMILVPDPKATAALALVTIHLSKNQWAATVLSLLRTSLKNAEITLSDLIVGSNEIFLVVSDNDLNTTLSKLHKDLLIHGSD